MIVQILAAAGYVLAALFAGLWVGERGRRRDLAWQQGKLREKVEQAKAEVVMLPSAEAEAQMEMENEASERYIKAVMDETGCSLKEAQKEAGRIFGELHRMGSRVEPY